MPHPGRSVNGISWFQHRLHGDQVGVVKVAFAVLHGRELVGEGRVETGGRGGGGEPLEQLLPVNFHKEVMRGGGVPADARPVTSHEEAKGERLDRHAVELHPPIQLKFLNKFRVVLHQVVVVPQHLVAPLQDVVYEFPHRPLVLALEGRGRTDNRELQVVVDDFLVSIRIANVLGSPLLAGHGLLKETLNTNWQTEIVGHSAYKLRGILACVDCGGGDHLGRVHGRVNKFTKVRLRIESVELAVVHFFVLEPKPPKDVIVTKEAPSIKLGNSQPHGGHTHNRHDHSKLNN
mmetsp:Transcript_27009/g.75482  ORF Transcript_27009/g.75482 Transcript_27009/m.75482 type:complete len:290 (-) Transcript_27009:250-1119(-)